MAKRPSATRKPRTISVVCGSSKMLRRASEPVDTAPQKKSVAVVPKSPPAGIA